jgi:hypothetical protein
MACPEPESAAGLRGAAGLAAFAVSTTNRISIFERPFAQGNR